MTHDHQDHDQATSAGRADDSGFAEFAALLLLVSDGSRFDSAMAALQARLAAAVAGAEDLAARRQSLKDDHARGLAKHLEAEAEIEARFIVAAEARTACNTRLARIRELYEAWRFIGETDLVVQGLQSPAWSPLDKALTAHGKAPAPVDDGRPSHGRIPSDSVDEPAHDRQAGSELTHARERRQTRSEMIRGAA